MLLLKLATSATTAATGMGMVGTSLKNLMNHRLSQFNPLPWSHDTDLTIVLINLYVARRPVLQVVDGNASFANDVTNVGFGTGDEVGFD